MDKTSAIMSEAMFVGCANLPECMDRALDLPWNYVGDVDRPRHWIQAICKKCSPRPSLFEPLPKSFKPYFVIVDLAAYQFVTDDMLEITVYFGRCSTCGRVYWAKQGPPFRRARCFVAA
jgi:rubredoxin